MNKKILSVMTAAVMAFSVMTVSVSADNEAGISDESFDYSQWILGDGTVSIDEGEYKGMYWVLLSDNSLQISGDYQDDFLLPDFSDTERPPFEKYKDQIKTVYVSEYVKYIGANTFKGYTNLKRVAFTHTGGLGYSQLETIGSSAFEGCTSLKKFSCPLTVKRISPNAFKNCSSITHFKMGAYTGVGTDAFAGVPLSHVDLHKGTQTFEEIFNEGNGLPSSPSCYHYYVAQESPEDSTDVVSQWLKEGVNASLDNLYFGMPSFDVCDEAGCPLDPLSNDDLEFIWDPTQLKTKVEHFRFEGTERYQIAIDWENSGKFFRVYDPINNMYLSGLDTNGGGGGGFAGYGSTEEEAAAAGLSFGAASACNDYYFHFYKDIQLGKSMVSKHISSDSWDFSDEEFFADVGEVINIDIPLKPDQKIEQLNITCVYQNKVEEIYCGKASKYSFTVTHHNAEYVIGAEIETENAELYQFVERLYSSILGRKSEPEGKQDWVNQLRNGATAAEVASGFVLSRELALKELENEVFLERMYWTFMERFPDEAGLADWKDALDSGCSYAFVLNNFVQSQEFLGICEEYGIKAGSYNSTEPRDQNRKLTAFVSRMYTKALGRKYDVDGLNDWTNQYLTGTATTANIAYGFIFSEEFLNKNLSDEAYVETLYATFFDRPSDADGKADWLNRMHTQGYSREMVLDGFLEAQEFINLKAGFGV